MLTGSIWKGKVLVMVNPQDQEQERDSNAVNGDDNKNRDNASPSQRLTASEAAARLGVKRSTLYAYVSRGLLDRSVALDGRTSLFDPIQVDGMRTSHRRTARGELSTVISSSITKLGEEGHQYRDRSVADLIASDLSFEAVADLIWQHDHDPSSWQLSPASRDDLRRAQLALVATSPLLDRLRVSVSVASASDVLRNARSDAAFVEAGRFILLSMVAGLAVSPEHGRSLGGIANDLWPGLTKSSRKRGARRNNSRVRALEVAMILMADHGLATSTFGVRLAASVRADPYSVVSTGLGSMGGVLHGSAADAVIRLLARADEIGAEVAIGERFAAAERIPGFGHKVYRTVDPREALLLSALETGWQSDPRLETIRQVRHLVTDRIDQPANIDLALGGLAWLGHFEGGATAVFAVARTVGWIAHAVEEMGEKPVRFRPVARYVPNRPDPDQPDGNELDRG